MATIAEWYLDETIPNGSGGSAAFRKRLTDGQRLGQAFFNSLSGTDQAKLRGTFYDPFNYGMVRTLEAIDYLTR